MVITAAPSSGTFCPSWGCSYTWSATAGCTNGAAIMLPPSLSDYIMNLEVSASAHPGISIAGMPAGQDAACTLTVAINDRFGGIASSGPITVKVTTPAPCPAPCKQSFLIYLAFSSAYRDVEPVLPSRESCTLAWPVKASRRPNTCTILAHTCSATARSLQVSKPPLSKPAITANATVATAPASIELAAPAGAASYEWFTNGTCGTAVTLGNAPGGLTSRTLILTSGASAASSAVFNLGPDAPASVACGLRVTVTDIYGSEATSNTTQITVQ